MSDYQCVKIDYMSNVIKFEDFRFFCFRFLVDAWQAAHLVIHKKGDKDRRDPCTFYSSIWRNVFWFS